MGDRGRGRIINIGSIAGRRMTFFGSVDYTVSKYGVEGLTSTSRGNSPTAGSR
jgi:NAD(P)-dependent dehydrogenase (short-subunit alcohol dehydrogenase family)